MGLFSWFRLKEEGKKRKIYSIEKKDWIEVYFEITYRPHKDDKKKDTEALINQICDKLIDIFKNEQTIRNTEGQILGHINSTLGHNVIAGHDLNIKELISLGFQRNFTFKVKKEKGVYIILIRAKKPSKSTRQAKGKNVVDVSKDKNKIYFYSPKDYSIDRDGLHLLAKDIEKRLKLGQTSTLTYCSYDKKKLILRNINGILNIKYDIENRIKLEKVNPELAKYIFGMSFKNFLKEFQEMNKEHSNYPFLKNWINKAEKMIKK